MAVMYFKALILVSIIFGTQAQFRTCPTCTNGYDLSSCAGTQSCSGAHDICELHVHTADKNRVEFICANSHACTNHETHPCSPTHHESCAYCCNSVSGCLKKMNDLFSTRYTTSAPQPTTVAPVTSSPDSTTAPTTDTTTSTTTSTTTTAKPGPLCVQCGDFATNRPCTATELLVARPTHCPAALPFCYMTIMEQGSAVNVIKGCAEDIFCKAEFDLNQKNPDCTPMNLAGPNDLQCTYCCKGDSCNVNVPPSADTIVNF